MILLKYRKHLIIFVVLVCAGVWLFVDKQQSNAKIQTTAASKNVEPVNEGSSAKIASSTIEAGKGTSVVNADVRSRSRSLFYEKYKNSTSFSEMYGYLEAHVSNLPEARYFQSVILRACFSFTGDRLVRLERKLQGETATAKRFDALNQLAERCRGLSEALFEIPPITLVRQAAAEGDPKAKSELFLWDNPTNKSEYLAAEIDVKILAESRDPIIIENIANYFQNRNDFLYWNIPGVEGTISGNDMAHAFRLAACDNGLDCSSTSPDGLTACVKRNICNIDNKTSEAQNFALSPAEFARAQHIREIINSGLSSGTWPKEFWTSSIRTRR
jgi:hypothetical protein